MILRCCGDQQGRRRRGPQRLRRLWGYGKTTRTHRALWHFRHGPTVTYLQGLGDVSFTKDGLMQQSHQTTHPTSGTPHADVSLPHEAASSVLRQPTCALDLAASLDMALSAAQTYRTDTLRTCRYPAVSNCNLVLRARNHHLHRLTEHSARGRMATQLHPVHSHCHQDLIGLGVLL